MILKVLKSLRPEAGLAGLTLSLVFASGCSGYRVLDASRQRSPDAVVEIGDSLPRGRSVRIALRDGTFVAGDVHSVLHGDIILWTSPEFSAELDTVRLADIRTIQVRTRGPLGLVGNTVGALAAVGLIVLAVFATYGGPLYGG